MHKALIKFWLEARHLFHEVNHIDYSNYAKHLSFCCCCCCFHCIVHYLISFLDICHVCVILADLEVYNLYVCWQFPYKRNTLVMASGTTNINNHLPGLRKEQKTLSRQTHSLWLCKGGLCKSRVFVTSPLNLYSLSFHRWDQIVSWSHAYTTKTSSVSDWNCFLLYCIITGKMYTTSALVRFVRLVEVLNFIFESFTYRIQQLPVDFHCKDILNK